MKGDRLRAVLAFYKEIYSLRPVIVVDVSLRITPAALSDLLLSAKQLGFEEELATFVFVVGKSPSVLSPAVGIHGLPVEGYRGPDFDHSEAVTYLAKKLGPFGHLATYVVEQVGTRAMHLDDVCRKCRGAESEEVCKERVGVYKKTATGAAHSKLDGFLSIAKANAGYSNQAGMALLEHLVEGRTKQNDQEARAAFGFEGQVKLLEALAECGVFEIDPFDHKLQSHHMATALREYLQGAEAESAPDGIGSSRHDEW